MKDFIDLTLWKKVWFPADLLSNRYLDCLLYLFYVIDYLEPVVFGMFVIYLVAVGQRFG